MPVPSGGSSPTSYATVAEYADWLDVAEADAPEGAERALRMATYDINQLLLASIYETEDGLPTDADLADALRDATCAQAEYAQSSGDRYGVGAARVTQASIGSISVTRSSGTAGGTGSGRYSERAWQILQQAGLTGHAVYH